MIVQEEFKINNLKFDLRYNANNDARKPLIIFFHGFKSFRNWGFIPFICSELANKGFPVINLDFELNGITSINPVQFDVEKFAENTVSNELKNASELINLLNKLHNDYDLSHKKTGDEEYYINDYQIAKLAKIIKPKWDGRINLAGHSRGAGISILCADRFDSIHTLALLAPIAHFDRYTNRLKAKWLTDGKLEFKDMMSNQILKMNSNYIADIEENKEEFNLLKTAEKLMNSVLIVHGTNDVSVPLSEPTELYNSFKKMEQNSATIRNFVLLQKANHLFNINHPFEKSNSYLDEVCDLLVNFFDEK
jgi:pimeloyl-ACP methyl ester carboxylesterase